MTKWFVLRIALLAILAFAGSNRNVYAQNCCDPCYGSITTFQQWCTSNGCQNVVLGSCQFQGDVQYGCQCYTGECDCGGGGGGGECSFGGCSWGQCPWNCE